MLTRIIVSLVFLISCSMSALADYSAAKDDFDRLPDQAKSQIAISLIATGDFDGVFTNQYTDRLNTAIETFQSREGFPPTGVLDATQIAKLEERANSSEVPKRICSSQELCLTQRNRASEVSRSRETTAP